MSLTKLFLWTAALETSYRLYTSLFATCCLNTLSCNRFTISFLCCSGLKVFSPPIPSSLFLHRIFLGPPPHLPSFPAVQFSFTSSSPITSLQFFLCCALVSSPYCPPLMATTQKCLPLSSRCNHSHYKLGSIRWSSTLRRGNSRF